jgi:penicillin G amidase
VKIVRIVAISLLIVVLLPLALAHALLSSSLPKLDGSLDAPGLTSSVSISRDERGVPTVVAANRAALAYGTGFVHAQDRFFQMDLSRRLAAGELSELFGRVALAQDEKARIFRFRHLARATLAAAPPEQRAVIEAYARGVNAGLASLRSRPWEYWLLQAQPAPWRAEDVALVSYAMWWDLQYNAISREMVKRALNARLGGAECAGGWKCALSFFYPRGTGWDAPNAAGPVAPATPVRIPMPDELDVRAGPDPTRGSPQSSARSSSAPTTRLRHSPARLPAAGSNGWAVAGTLTSSGSALVASDMHLNLRVPTVWYRARLRAGAMDLNGLTLAGAPVLVAGSNGHIAWSFTNSYGDWSDLTFVPCTAVDGDSVRTQTETIPLSSVPEIIHVKGEPDVTFPVKSGPGGLLYVAQPQKGRCWFVRWLAAVPGSTNFNILNLESATSASQAIALAPSIGIPHQNFMVGDTQGHIGWSILGRIPNALGEARLNGAAPWDTLQTHPKLLDPAAGRIWTANARSIDDPAYEAIIGGDEASLGADYDLGARAHQIRDDLMAVTSGATSADMLRIQTDDRAQFLTRWHDLLEALLDDQAVRGHPERAQFRHLITDWRARASTDSVGYRLVRSFHTQAEDATWEMLLDALAIDARDAPPPAQFEGALWELASQQPMHLLSAAYPTWRDFLLAQVDATIADLRTECPDLAQCRWSTGKLVQARHPLSRSLPFASRLLDMPALALPGDHDMPRVQDGAFGASERFAVSPGHETEGYLEIAGGQSGHPLSPYYRAGFSEWAKAKPIPFLPTRPEHELTLIPAR